MPVTPTYPGVYVEEVPSGVRTITGVATSITAFVGRTLKGPVNEPVTIHNFGAFETIFGGLWSKGPMTYAVSDFYRNGGARAIIVRLYKPLSDADKQEVSDKAKRIAQGAADAVVKAVQDARGEPAENEDVPKIKEALKAAAQEAVAQAGKAETAHAAAEAVAQATAAAADAADKTLADVIQAAKDAVAPAVTAAAGKAVPEPRAKLDVDGLVLVAAHPGAWSNALLARTDHDCSEEVADAYGLEKEQLFNLTVRDKDTGVTERFRNVTTEDDHARNVQQVIKNRSQLVRVDSYPKDRQPKDYDAGITDEQKGKDPFQFASLCEKANVLASDGAALTKEDFVGKGMEGKKEGLYALKKADLFNLLCIPPYSFTSDAFDLVPEAARFCEQERAMLLVDPPIGWTTKEHAIKGVEGPEGVVKSKNAALFFPRLRQPNPLKDNQKEDFVPCGAVAGVFARTDTQRGVWKAPAGLEANLFGVPELSVPLTDDENGELNPLGINCLRALPAAGRVVWGSRTLRGADRLASEWKYIPVRRLALYIEESLYRGTQWVVFEPNDEPLWSQIRLNVGTFMHNLFRQGAFQGTTPRDAYFVRCGHDTNPQNDIDLGIVNIVVGFAPLKPAEFVILKIQQIAGQLET